MAWKFYGKTQFPSSFGRFARNYAEIVPIPQNFHTMKLGKITVFYAVVCDSLMAHLGELVRSEEVRSGFI